MGYADLADPVRRHERDRLHQAPRQHLAAAGRHRSRASEPRGERGTAAGPAPQRPAAAELASPDPHAQCRPGHLSRPDQPLRLGRGRAGNPARTDDRGGARRAVRIPSTSEAEAELEIAARAGARFVGIGEPDYPPLLKRMDNPPPLLAIKGTAAIFSLPPVAIVGARNASLAGIKMARMLAAELGRRGLRGHFRAGARHRHGRASRQPCHRHGGGAGRRARPALPAGKCRPLPTRSPSAAARSFPKCRSAGSRGRRIFPAATASSPAWRSVWWWSRRPSARAR